jgi:hypothetical protein
MPGPPIALASHMRSIVLACLLLALTASASAQQPSANERARVVAALERLMTTGEPPHTSHDEGQWLQAAVDAAIARGDVELERLARRAAVPLLAHVTAPVSSHPPGLSFQSPTVLKVPTPASYRADLFVSIDGEDAVRIGSHPGMRSSNISALLPQSASRPGLHHLRVTAHITYAGSGLPAETRQLPDIVYGIYDPNARTPFDAGYVLDAAKGANVKQLDPRLPDARFELWLQSIAAAHGGKFDRVNDWTIQPCDARTIEHGLPARSPEICATAWFGVKDGTVGIGVGQVWIRTARLEFVNGKPLLVAEMPTVEGVTLAGADFEMLSALPDLLGTPRETWARADVSVAPEDITVTPMTGAVRVNAVIRNAGAVDAHGVEVFVGATKDGLKDTRRTIVVVVPKRGARSITVTLPFDHPYGAVVVHAAQMSDHTPSEMWHPDPTPEDAVAFRIVNPRLTPNRYVEFLTSQCGFVCRGY